MTKKTNTRTSSGNDFNLKHRITGAGVLIFFGVLVMPWMLGPPSEAQKSSLVEITSDTPQVVPLHSTFEDQVLAELEGVDPDFVEPEESVYVSKITPVGGQASKPEKVSSNPNASSNQSVDDSETKPSMASLLKKATEKSQPPVSDVSEEVSKNSPPESLPQIQNSEVTTEPKVDVGWVVQVELLTDEDGANRLVQRLSDKGFKPQTTTVDTNLGKATGTRIWLGPFAERGGAGRENDRLEKQMGKRGFIRVYP